MFGLFICSIALSIVGFALWANVISDSRINREEYRSVKHQVFLSPFIVWLSVSAVFLVFSYLHHDIRAGFFVGALTLFCMSLLWISGMIWARRKLRKGETELASKDWQPADKEFTTHQTTIKRIFYGMFIPTLILLCLGAWFSGFFLKIGIWAPMIILAAIGQFTLQIWMLSDCANREFDSKNAKKNWIGAILFFGIFGALVYFLKVKGREPDLNY